MTIPKIKEVAETLEWVKENIVLVNDQLFDKRTEEPVHTNINGSGYLTCHLNGIAFIYHRLVYFLYSGLWPEIVDHKDGNKLNNHPSNLRAANKAENNYNKRKAKTREFSSEYKGVSFHKSMKKWQATITFQGKFKHIGYFKTPEEAARYYDIYAQICFGEFAVINNHAETARILDEAKAYIIAQRKLEKALA